MNCYGELGSRQDCREQGRGEKAVAEKVNKKKEENIKTLNEYLGFSERCFSEKIFPKVLVPRRMETGQAVEAKEVFCGSYTTFVITSGFN